MRSVRIRSQGSAIGVIAVVLLAVFSASVSAELVPTTQSGSGGDVALHTDVSIAPVGDGDQVVFTFAGGVLPESVLTFVDGGAGFQNPDGGLVSVAGSAFVAIRMSPASGVDWGVNCVDPPTVTPGPGEVLTTVYWSCPADTPGAYPVVRASRAVPDGDAAAVLTAAVAELLGGPSAEEEADGLESLFSAASAGLLTGLSIEPDGTAIVDFDPALVTALPNASASAASEQLLRELDATVMWPSEVTGAEYRLGGSCDAFFGWLQRGCEPRTLVDAAAATYAATYLGPGRVAGAGGLVTEAVQISDFESQLVWVVGLSQEAAVDATTAQDPARLVLNVTALPEPASVPPTQVEAEPAPPVTTPPRFTG